jgi:hypothetical protein
LSYNVTKVKKNLQAAPAYPPARFISLAVDFVDKKYRFVDTCKTARVRGACVADENLGRPEFKQIQQGAIPK